MKTRILILSAFVAILSSCAGFTKVTVPHSSVSYGEKDFEITRSVEYTLTKSYFLGIGGMSAKARNTNIVKELIRKANLQKNETLSYISVSQNVNTFLGIITTVDYVASGHVVRPIGEYAPTTNEYKDVPYQGAFQGEDSIVAVYETTGGAKLVKDLKKKIVKAYQREELINIKKEVAEAYNNEQIDNNSATTLFQMINSRLINCDN